MSVAGTRDPFRLFLSGSTADFAQVRLGFSKALTRGQLHVIHQADFPQAQADTVLKLAQLIAPCGILIHLIGRQPGSVAAPAAVKEYLAFAETQGGFLKDMPALRAALGDCSDLTYTQWEVFIALHLGLHVFVYGDATHADPAHPQRVHLDRLVSVGKYTDTFTDPEDLKDKVWADLLWHYRNSLPAAQLPEVFRPSNLPGGYIGRLFLGRDDFLEKLREALGGKSGATAITQSSGSKSAAPAATSLAGLGGIGKTHTAIAYADRYRGDYSALLFISGETPARLSATLAGLCGVLHLDRDGSLPPDEPTRVTAAVEWLAGHRGWLLIVDNVDDPAAAIALTELLGDLSTGHVLITTRLHGWTDSVRTLDLSVLDPDHATELLLDLTKSVHAFTGDDRAAARLLAADLDGLPLAIHQAAGYIVEQHLSLAEARAFYQREARELLGWFDHMRIRYAAPQDIGPQPVLFTWKASFDKLSEDSRRWLRVFAYFAPETIPEFLIKDAPEAKEGVKARHRAVRAALAQADKYCLLTREREPAGFRLHRLVQHIIRLSATEEERAAALAEGIQLIIDSDPGDPLDVRSWPRWNPLQAHAVSLCDHAPDKPAPERLSWLLNELGNLCLTKALHSQAEPMMRRALAIDEASLGKDHPEVAIRLNNLASLLQDTNRLGEAEPLIRRVVDILENKGGDPLPNYAGALNNLATLLQDTNRLGEAEPLMRRALDIDEASFGKDHPKVATSLNNLATLLYSTNRLGEAELLMRRALGIDEASFGKDHPNVAIDLNNLAELLRTTNHLAEAEPLMRRALAISVASFGAEYPTSQTFQRNLNRLLAAKG